MVTLSPLACNNLARDAAIIPLPKEEVTPPVTKIYLTIKTYPPRRSFKKLKKYFFSSYMT
jgi:hypothetical protein